MRSLPIAAALLLLAPLPALAHPGGAAGGMLAGFLHPLSGWDHLLAMVAVGLWAGVAGSAARFALPAAFLGGMALGGSLGMTQFSLPMLEASVLVSVLVLGALVAFAAQPRVLLAVPLLVVFGLLHGHAHGLEMGVGTDGLSYAAGFLAATAMLHGTGLMLSSRTTPSGPGRLLVRMAGGATACLALVIAGLG